MVAAKMLGDARVRTGEVRLSFVHLLEPRPAGDEGGADKYSAALLVPKSDTATLDALQSAREAAILKGEERFGKSWSKGTIHSTLRDGDTDTDTDKYPENAGCMVVNVSSIRKPGVVDTAMDPITDPSDIYSGCYASVSVDAYPYSYMGKKGVSFGLRNVQKTRDGEGLGGSSRAEDDFEVVGSDDLI